MADSARNSPSTRSTRRNNTPCLYASLSLLLPVLLSIYLYRIELLDPAPIPKPLLTHHNSVAVPRVNDKVLSGAELMGVGQLVGPEDFAYESVGKVLYTSCADGWIKRVKLSQSGSVNETVVEDWVNTGGRPLGLALGRHGEVIVADADKGLLSLSKHGEIKLLTDQAEGIKFKLTDGVDVAQDGVIYFTDASYKHTLSEFIWDILEGRPYGRLMSYDPKTEETKVLVRDLYFANGVTMSPDQDSVVFCETPIRRCRKYYINGERKGELEIFIDNLPGFPDNIRYDGEGHYWIALPTANTIVWDLTMKYPVIRKGVAIMTRYVGRPYMDKNAGVYQVDLQGKPIAYYYDPTFQLITGGLKIGNYLYLGSLFYGYIIRLDLIQHAAS